MSISCRGVRWSCLHNAAQAPAPVCDSSTLQIQPGRGRSFAAPHRLQAIVALIAVQLKSISIRIDKVDALGNQVVDRPGDGYVVSLQGSVAFLELGEAAYLQCDVMESYLLVSRFGAIGGHFQHRQVMMLLPQCEEHTARIFEAGHHFEAKYLGKEPLRALQVTNLQHNM